MRVFKDQILGGTLEDTQGERLSLSVLQRIASTYQGKRQPLNQDHDPTKSSAGYMENVRVVDHPGIEGEYALIGDIYCDESRLEIAMRGFSISYLEVIKRSKEANEFIVYLPYPHYNDPVLIQMLSEQTQHLSIGKWVKKAADPATTALICGAIIFVLSPVWDDYYKKVLAPKLYGFIRNSWRSFKDKNISCDIAQVVEIEGHQIQLILIPDRTKDDICFKQEYLEQSMKLAHSFILKHSNPSNLVRIHLYFHNEDVGYRVDRVEDSQGNVQHHA